MMNMRNKKIWILLLIVILVTLVLLFIDKSTYKKYSKNYFYMDTYINIKIDSVKSRKEIDSIFDDINYLYDSYNKLTNRYSEYNDVINVYYLNEILGDGEEIEIDKRLADIIELGIAYYDKTNGLFNVASGNLTGIWKSFIDTCESVPSNDTLDVNTNINDVKLKGNIYTKYNGVRLDLGAITKGYVTEIVSRYLEDNSINNYIINAGGNVKVGKAYDKEYYVVGITDPNNINSIFTKVNINNLSVVTSGSYQRYCMLDDKLYSHVINSITKYPSDYVKSVTVIGEDSTLCDIYSTYLFLLSVDDGLDVVNNTSGIEAIWYVDGDNIVRSDGFNYE